METFWEHLLDKLMGAVVTSALLLAPAVAIWLKARAAFIEAQAARLQGETNALKADEATKEAKAAKDTAVRTATVIVDKIDENTAITKDVSETLKGAAP